MIKRVIEKVKGFIYKVLYYLTGNNIIKKTQWYRNLFVDYDYQIYPGNIWYREHDERNFDIVALGSSSAKWAFDFENTNVKGMNWANQPQTLQEDYNLLRHYHSILHKGSYVLITIMPFSGLNKATGLKDALKYVRLDYQGEAIQPYMYEEACRYARIPILFGRPAVKALVRYVLRKESKNDISPLGQGANNPMTKEQLEENALGFINGWKEQFQIADFDAPLTPLNQEGRDYRIHLMRELIDFCIERDYKPVYIIPPVTNSLSSYFTPTFEKRYVYDFLEQVERDILLLDYSKDTDLKRDNLYFNSFFLNKKGASLFTKRVLKDLNLEKFKC